MTKPSIYPEKSTSFPEQESWEPAARRFRPLENTPTWPATPQDTLEFIHEHSLTITPKAPSPIGSERD